jgi:hypothetical protein
MVVAHVHPYNTLIHYQASVFPVLKLNHIVRHVTTQTAFHVWFLLFYWTVVVNVHQVDI